MGRSYEISNMLCPVCNKTFPIPRRKDHRRANGHIKDIWCPFCKDVQKMVEYHPAKAICTMG